MTLFQQIWLDILNDMSSKGLHDLFQLFPYLMWLIILYLPLRQITPIDNVTCATYVGFMMAAGDLLLIGSSTALSEHIPSRSVFQILIASIAFGVLSYTRFRKRKFDPPAPIFASNGVRDGHYNKAN